MLERDFDPIQLEVCWNSLIAIASEQAATMVNSSFSAVLGEMEDLSAGVFDANGTMMAQSVQGAPGHLGSLSIGMKHFRAAFPDAELTPGDVLITNDPWLVSGHKHDISIVTPVFRGAKVVGFTASNCHTVDIGGCVFSTAAAEVYEEGLQIPLMKLYEGGRRNEMLIRLIAENVRSSELVLGDLMAQVSANETAARRLLTLMAEHGMAALEPLSKAITTRSERLLRAAIREVPDGVYRDRISLDGFDEALEIAVAVEVAGDRIMVDYAGSSGQVPKGINCVLNYTKAFTQYALKCLLAPDSPNNDGSFAAIEVRAPEASIVNARHPIAVGGRHLVGLCIPFAIFGALTEVLPRRVVADSSVLSAVTVNGLADDERPFVFTFFSSGGMGARAGKDGLDATAFPSNVANAPIEVMEQTTPILFGRRALIEDSFGAGRQRGGAGQSISFRLRTAQPARISCMIERTSSAPRGFHGGGSGRLARLTRDGIEVDPKRSLLLQPGEELCLETPGGGGYGPAGDRDPAQRALDRQSGLSTGNDLPTVEGIQP